MHRYLIFAAAGLSLFLYSIDSTPVSVAFPNFIRDFDTNVLWAAWTISIYMVAVMRVMPLMGNLSDTFGRKQVATITGLRGMFRYVGGAFGISLTTIILHTCSALASGFRMTFILSALVFLCTIPLAFLMPTGKS